MPESKVKIPSGKTAESETTEKQIDKALSKKNINIF